MFSSLQTTPTISLNLTVDSRVHSDIAILCFCVSEQLRSLAVKMTRCWRQSEEINLEWAAQTWCWLAAVADTHTHGDIDIVQFGSPDQKHTHSEHQTQHTQHTQLSVISSAWPSCSTRSCPPPWGGTWTTTRKCTTCSTSFLSSFRTSFQINTVRDLILLNMNLHFASTMFVLVLWSKDI